MVERFFLTPEVRSYEILHQFVCLYVCLKVSVSSNWVIFLKKIHFRVFKPKQVSSLQEDSCRGRSLKTKFTLTVSPQTFCGCKSNKSMYLLQKMPGQSQQLPQECLVYKFQVKEL